MSSCCFCFRTRANNSAVDNNNPQDLRHDSQKTGPAPIRHSERKIEEDLHLETYMSDYLHDQKAGEIKNSMGGCPNNKRKNHMDSLNVELS